MKDINALYVKALSSVIVPPGVAIGNAVGTSRFAYGFQVFSDLASGEDIILLANGDVVSADHAREERRAMFAGIVDGVFEEQAAEERVVVAEIDPKGKIPESNLPDLKDYVAWSGSDEYPSDIGPDEKIYVLYRNGGESTGPADRFRWSHEVPGNSYDIVGYRRQKTTDDFPAINGLPEGYTRWDGNGADAMPPDIHPRDTVSVFYHDGVSDEGWAADFKWSRNDPRTENTQIFAYKLIKKFEEDEVPVVEMAREDIDSAINNTSDEIHFGPITDAMAAEAGFKTLEPFSPDERFSDPGRVAAFRFADGHVVVARDGSDFIEKYIAGASTFRPLEDHERVFQYTIYPKGVTFNSPVPEGRYKTHNVDVLDRVRIFFVVGSPVYKHAFEVDWSFVGDPRNDVVAYEILKGA